MCCPGGCGTGALLSVLLGAGVSIFGPGWVLRVLISAFCLGGGACGELEARSHCFQVLVRSLASLAWGWRVGVYEPVLWKENRLL